MLTQMEVFTSGILTPPWPIADQNVSMDPIQIKNIEGLGPVKASVNTAQYGSIDGEFFNGSYTPKRNIVITVSLNPNWVDQTIEGLRQILYSYFTPETQVRLRFTSTHLSQVEIIGYVESFEPQMFAQDPEYQISIICPNPYFVNVNSTVIQGTTQAFAAPSDVIVNYEGNVNIGFVVDFILPSGGTAFTGEVRVVNSTPTTKLSIVTPVTVSSTSLFRLSSVQSDKFARQYPQPSGLPTNILGKVSPGSSWLTLRRGDNKIQVLSATAGLNWSLSYFARYGGL